MKESDPDEPEPLTQKQLLELVRTDLADLDLVGELFTQRRAEAAAEDGA
jgi:hypothetical protein